jgi:hypothetical protein
MTMYSHSQVAQTLQSDAGFWVVSLIQKRMVTDIQIEARVIGLRPGPDQIGFTK